MSLTTVREAAYQVLRDLGMTKIFGNPGSTELPFLRNLPSDFSYVLALHERTAVGMGLGYAMARGRAIAYPSPMRSEEHTSELQSHVNLVCRLLLEKKNLYRTSSAKHTEP